jgi:hypothetical protein
MVHEAPPEIKPSKRTAVNPRTARRVGGVVANAGIADLGHERPRWNHLEVFCLSVTLNQYLAEEKKGRNMFPALELPDLRRFFDDLNDRARRCDNAEGMICSTLDESIDHYVQLCRELRECVNQWARAIFTGRVAFDQAAENLLKEEMSSLLHRAKQVAARGRAMDGQCFVLQGLNSLHFHMADLNYLLDNWVSPRVAVSPAPRVQLSNAVEQQVIERLKSLSPMPSDWCPTDPEQLAIFQKQRSK